MRRPDLYLLRLGEVSLKGRNRKEFIDDLVNIIKYRVKPLGGKVEKSHKRLFLRIDQPAELVKEALSTVYGLSGVSPIYLTSHDLDDIEALTWELIQPHVGSGKTFAIRTKRSNKRFPLNSMQVDHELATRLFNRGLDLKVQLKKPDITVGLTIESEQSLVYMETWPGLGGMPVRRRDEYGLLLSGGIDSPVAGNLIQKRGGWINGIYFHTPPYTVEAAKEKVIDLAQVLSRYQNLLNLYVVNFTEVMQTLKVECHAAYTVVLSRRMMMRAANMLAEQHGMKGLVTGESLGQVASQTIENLHVVNSVAEYPVLRPCISMDKEEIVQHAKRIDSFEISIRPGDDCCSLFSPKEPVTRARAWLIEEEETKIDMAGLLERAMESVEEISFRPRFAEDVS